MPRKINNSTTTYRCKRTAFAIIVMVMLSGIGSILIQPYSISPDKAETEHYMDNIFTTDKEEIPIEMPLLERNTRNGEEEYMNLMWEGGYGTFIGYENSIVSADTNNDGNAEIIFGNNEGFVHILQHSDGEYTDLWKSPDLGYSTHGLTTGDVDNDGIIEIVVGTGSGEIYIIGYQPESQSYTEEWSFGLLTWDALALATGDIDNDGISEVIVGTNSYGATGALPNVYVFGYDGSTYTLEWMYWAEDSYLNNVRTIVIGDVDGDGNNEFVVGISEYKYVTESPRGSFYIFGYNNGIYTLEWKKDDTSVDIVDIDIGNIDDDEMEEIIVGAALVDIYQYQSGAYIIESILPDAYALVEVGDTNNDGQNEIVTGNSNIEVWKEGTLLWESEDLPSEIYGITIYDSDNDFTNEIITSLGEWDYNSEVRLFSHNGADYQEEWKSNFISPLNVISIGDIDDDGDNELLAGKLFGDLYIYRFYQGDYLIEDIIPVSNQSGINYILIEDFDDDGLNEIVASVSSTLNYIEYDGENYAITHQLQIENGSIVSIDKGDVDNDGIIEIVIGTWEGYVDIVGFDGNFYVVEWENRVYNYETTAVGVGDTEGDGTSEIVVGGIDSNFPEYDYTLYVLGFNNDNYSEEWVYTANDDITAIDIADSDNDNVNEIVFTEYSELFIFGWNEDTYSEEWSSTDFISVYDDCIDISKIESNDTSKLIIGDDELYVLNYTTTYDYLWQTEHMSDYISNIFVGDADNYGSNEIVVNIDTYIYIYGKEERPKARLYVSETTVDVGQEVIFNGSNSTCMGQLEYYFDFGDNKNTGWITESTSTHSYTKSGTYVASLKVRDENGIESYNIAEHTITVIKLNKAPKAFIDKISPNPSTFGYKVSFAGHGLDEDGIITSYYWESDIDGKLSESNSFSNSSLSVGKHSISFKVKDDMETWSDIVTENLTINPKPQNQAPDAYIDSISPNPAIVNEIVSFSGHGVDADGTVASYQWESDINGKISNENSFSMSTLSIGEHTISFSVKDDDGTWSLPDTKTLTIEPEPPNQAPRAYIESISPNPATEGETVTFEGYGEDDDGTIVSCFWESDIDGSLSDKRIFSTSSLSVGEHTITFGVKDDEDMWSETETATLIVNEKSTSGEPTGETDEENNTFFIFLIGIIILVIIAIIASVIVFKRKKNTNTGQVQVSCPGCGQIYNVTSDMGPLTLYCPSCGLAAVLNS